MRINHNTGKNVMRRKQEDKIIDQLTRPITQFLILFQHLRESDFYWLPTKLVPDFGKSSSKIKWLYRWKRIQNSSKCLAKIWCIFILRWYYRVVEANKNQALITTNIVKTNLWEHGATMLSIWHLSESFFKELRCRIAYTNTKSASCI